MKIKNPIPKVDREKIRKSFLKTQISDAQSFEVLSQIIFNNDYMGFAKDVSAKIVGLKKLDYDTFKTDSAFSKSGFDYDSLNRRYVCQDGISSCEIIFKIDAKEDVRNLMLQINDVNPNGENFTKYYASNNNSDWQEITKLADVKFDDPNKTIYLKVIFEEDAHLFSSDFFISEYAIKYNYY